MAKHERAGASNEWYTPAFVFEAMGVRFDLDVSAPWAAACPAGEWCDDAHYSDSLARVWSGFVWMNPPFGGRNGLVPWLEKFFGHGNGVALVPDRTSAPWWQDFAPRADLIMQVRKKIHFIPGPRVTESSPAQGTTLIACGATGVRALENAFRAGLGSCWAPHRAAAAA